MANDHTPVAAKYDALVLAVMRGSHRQARDLARSRFVEMNPDERGHAEKVIRDTTINAELLTALEAYDTAVGKLPATWATDKDLGLGAARNLAGEAIARARGRP